MAIDIKIVLEPSEDGGFTVSVPSLPGCISEGETRDEALHNIREAIELYPEPVEDNAVLPAGAEVTSSARSECNSGSLEPTSPLVPATSPGTSTQRLDEKVSGDTTN